ASFENSFYPSPLYSSHFVGSGFQVGGGIPDSQSDGSSRFDFTTEKKVQGLAVMTARSIVQSRPRPKPCHSK
ncbi:MAG: hypothetical protein ACAH59_03240, partial [Pseudobdellovibrionaceae bacterium]